MRTFYRVCQFPCRAAFLTLARGRVFGLRHVPAAGPGLLVCNHQSFLDPVLAAVALEREAHFMARESLFRQPRFRWLIETLNAYPVKRGEGDVGAIKETLRRLRQGALVTVFPEGTRTPDGGIGPMKPGIVLIARKARVPVIPTLIAGAYDMWPRNARLPRPGRIVVAYDEPIAPEALDGLEPEAAIETVRGRVVALSHRFAPEASGRRNRLKRRP